MKTQTFITVLAIVIFPVTMLSQVSFTEITGTPFVGVRYSSNAFADINNDGLIDIAVSGESFTGERITKIYINDGNYNFHALENTPFADIAKGDIALIDIDNDNDIDFFLAGQTDSFDLVAKLYLNNGQGDFTEKPSSTLSAGYLCDAKFADIDNDDDLDLFITGANYPMLFINDGTGSFTNAQNNPFGPAWNSSIAFSDFDKDGDQDLGIIGRSFGEYYSKIYVNDGTGIFTQINTTRMRGLAYGAIGFVDIDNSGFEEVFTSGQGHPYRRSNLYYFKDGVDLYTPISNTKFTRISGGSADFADVNNDNYMDILSTGHTGAVIILDLYINNKNGTFNTLSNTNLDGVFEGEASFVDIDNDNDMDVFITGYSSSGKYIAKLYVNDLITGLPKENTPRKIKLYPNPSNGIINIDFQVPENNSISIYNLTGQLLYHFEKINKSSFQFELNVPTGIYFVKVHSENETQQFKLIMN